MYKSMNAFTITERDLFLHIRMVVNLFRCYCLMTSVVDNNSYLKQYNKVDVLTSLISLL